MIAPEKEISICNDDVDTHHGIEEEVELDDEHPHHEDGPSPRRPHEATPQAQKKSIAEERAKRQIKPPSRYIEECDYIQYALTVASQVETNNDDPCSYKEAMFQSDAGNCVYFKELEGGSFIYLLLYVDDMLVACKNMIEVNNLKRLLSSEFDMKDFGETKKILALKELCPQSKEEEKDMAHIPYTSAVGSVMYDMMSRPGKVHWEAVNWFLRYLKGTSSVCLEFGRDANRNVGFCDSDYGGDLDDRKSTSDYVFTLGGTAVSWQYSIQVVVAISTTEA
uniref:Reverse transcriptase Ty1/copia-type domain-containing protein n=1 Tax=Chenopodium quinoa TaxID=63459 RepID=A0A803KP57_CHEQI